MAELSLNMLRRNAKVTAFNFGLIATPVRVMGRNPIRFYITIPSDPVQSICWWIGDTVPPGAAIIIPPASSSLVLSEDDVGGATTEPFWMWCPGGNVTCSVFTVWYQQHEFSIYERITREFLSKFQSP